MRNRYLVVVEKSETNSSAYSPDVRGCAATGRSIEETLVNFREALELHLESMLENEEEIPVPRTLSFYLTETDEISTDDIITHVEVTLPDRALA